jgi:hypothetical protein
MGFCPDTVLRTKQPNRLKAERDCSTSPFKPKIFLAHKGMTALSTLLNCCDYNHFHFIKSVLSSKVNGWKKCHLVNI